MGGTPVGADAAAAAAPAAAVPAAFLRTLAVVAPVRPHVPDGAGIIVDVKLLLAEGEPAMHHRVEPQLTLQQLLGNNESRHGHVKGKMGGDDFVASQDAAHDHRLCLNVDQFVAVALPDEMDVVLVARRAAGHRDVDR